MEDSKLQEIRAAEKQAADIIEEAKQIYRKNIAEAQESALSSFEQEKTQVKQKVRELIEGYRKEGQAEAREILGELEKQTAELYAQTEKKRAKAVEYVISELKR